MSNSMSYYGMGAPFAHDVLMLANGFTYVLVLTPTQR